ncbi:hypothetical protein A9Q84_03210 [Halobacteriovorax marinus]|uniref:Lipid/polyisoprenoid-binding YceI-like domain-containing protein n=1 Tax=Halobacteriovorax marinus TaxID=97084 RepID=A0A1Y5FDA2_9BACT|nr:hypothetical protein A9Q84_03210 [Halobacteriovorax marinus]
MKILLLLLISFNLSATEIKFTSADYDQALENKSTIIFDMESTKAGFITSGFKGVAKSFSVDFKRVGDTFKDVKITIPVSAMDTDIDARNEKMYEECFDFKNNQNIIVKFKSAYLLGFNGIQKGSILIRGKWFDIDLKIDSKMVGGVTLINGSSSLSIKDLEIPDPSIWIASVRDLIELTFKIEIK